MSKWRCRRSVATKSGRNECGFNGIGRVYMHVVVDTWCRYAFGFKHVSKQVEAALALLHNDVLAFYQKHKLIVENILTDNDREFCGADQHPYELYWELNDVKHSRTKVQHPQTSGFVKRFNRTMLDEFFRIKMREKVYDTLESLQADFDYVFSLTMNNALIWVFETKGKAA